MTPDIPSEEVERVAAGLTKAQCKILLGAHETLFGGTRITSARMDPRVRNNLWAKGIYERTEALMGRTAWTFADYLEEGRRLFDDRGPGQPGMERLHVSMREESAKAYARLSCPPAKRRAEMVAANEEFPA